jgi:predicted nucleic acid-binding protein
MSIYVLDTNIVSALLSRNPIVTARLDATATPQNTFLACPMVWHEIQRGLLAKGAKIQMRLFEILFDQFVWQDYKREDWSQAATLWVKRRKQGAHQRR